MLLLYLHRFALRLRPFVPLCYLLGFGSAALALLLIARDGSQQALALALTLGVSIWALLLFAFVNLFQSIPPPVLPQDSFFERLRARCKLGLYHLLALGSVLVTLVLVALSLKLLSANT